MSARELIMSDHSPAPAPTGPAEENDRHGYAQPTRAQYEEMRQQVVLSNQRAEQLAARILDARRALLQGALSDAIDALVIDTGVDHV
jgi:hypothetical protein